MEKAIWESEDIILEHSNTAWPYQFTVNLRPGEDSFLLSLEELISLRDSLVKLLGE